MLFLNLNHTESETLTPSAMTEEVEKRKIIRLTNGSGRTKLARNGKIRILTTDGKNVKESYMSTIEIAGQEINYYQLEMPIESCNTYEKMRTAICEILEKIGESSFVESSIVDDDGVSISFEAHGPLISPPAKGCLKLVSWYFYDESTYSIDTDDDEITILTKTHLGTEYLIGYRQEESILSAENNDSDDWTGNMVSIMIGDMTDENLDALAEVLTEQEVQNDYSKSERIDAVARKFHEIVLNQK